MRVMVETGDGGQGLAQMFLPRSFLTQKLLVLSGVVVHAYNLSPWGGGRRISQSRYVRSCLPLSPVFLLFPCTVHLFLPPPDLLWGQNLTWAPVDSSSYNSTVVLPSPPSPFNIRVKAGPLQVSHYHFYPGPKPGNLPASSSSSSLPGKVLLEAAPVTTFCNQN